MFVGMFNDDEKKEKQKKCEHVNELKKGCVTGQMRESAWQGAVLSRWKPFLSCSQMRDITILSCIHASFLPLCMFGMVNTKREVDRNANTAFVDIQHLF